MQRCIARIKPSGEQFYFIYHPGDAEALIEVLSRYVINPELNFTIEDAIWVNGQMRELDRLEAAIKASRRF